MSNLTITMKSHLVYCRVNYKSKTKLVKLNKVYIYRSLDDKIEHLIGYTHYTTDTRLPFNGKIIELKPCNIKTRTKYSFKDCFKRLSKKPHLYETN